MTRRRDLEDFRGDTIPFNLTFKDGDGVAIDITGWTVFFTLKEAKTDTDANAKIKKTVTSHSDPTNGLTTVTLTATETAALTPGDHYYDLQYKDDSGTIKTILQGKFKVLTDITIRTSA